VARAFPQTTNTTMAKCRIKAGGPTRGRNKVRKIGMGSGKYLAARKAARKGPGAK